MPPIIDSHVHLYPSEIARDPRAWAVSMGEYAWADMVAPQARNGLQGWADEDRLLADMDRAGIDKAVLLGWYWEHQKTCEWQNQYYAEARRRHPDRFLAFATVQPLAGDRAVEALRRAAGEGLCGLGELLPCAQGFSMQDGDWLQVVETAIELNMPVNLHGAEPAGREYPGRGQTPLSDYQWLAARYPELQLILAHWGGLLPFYELNRAVRRDLSNVYYDTAASPLLYDARVYQAVASVIGTDRILFGTDYPLLLYPRKDKEPGFTRLLEEIRQSGLADAALDHILGGNAERLFRLHPS